MKVKINKYASASKRAQKAYRRHRSCDRKRAFDTEAEAAEQRDQKPYRCSYCGKWHRTGAFTTLVNTARKR